MSNALTVALIPWDTAMDIRRTGTVDPEDGIVVHKAIECVEDELFSLHRQSKAKFAVAGVASVVSAAYNICEEQSDKAPTVSIT